MSINPLKIVLGIVKIFVHCNNTIRKDYPEIFLFYPENFLFSYPSVPLNRV